MDFVSAKFQRVKRLSKEYYRSIGRIYCPYFKDYVYFDSKGFKHILYKGYGGGNKRQKSQIVLRLKMLPYAPRLIAIATFVQEFQKDNSINYWGFIAIFEGEKFKVVVRRVGNGKLHFWTIFPNWVTRKKSDKKQAPVDSFYRPES